MSFLAKGKIKTTENREVTKEELKRNAVNYFRKEDTSMAL